MDSTRRRQREQARRERNQQVREHHSTSDREPKPPLFGPVQRMDSQDDLRLFAKTVLGDYESAGDDSQLASSYISVSPVTPASSSLSSYKTLGKVDPGGGVGGHVKDRDGLDRQPQAKPESHRSKSSKKSHHKASKHHLATESPMNENLSMLGHVSSVNLTSLPNQALKSQHHAANKISSHSKPVPSSATQLAVKKEPKTEDSYRKPTVPPPLSPSSSLPKQKKHKKSKQHKLEKQQSDNLNLTKSLSFDKPATSLFTTATISHHPAPLRRSSSSGAAETAKNKSDLISQSQSVLRNPFPLKTASESVSSSEKQRKKEKKSRREKAEQPSVDSKPKPAAAQVACPSSFAHSQAASDSQKATSEFTNKPFQKPLQSMSTSSLARHARPAKLSIQTSFSQPLIEDISTDSCDLQYMLKEMTLPQSLTPLCTPTQKKNFSFPPQVSHGGAIPAVPAQSSTTITKSARSETGGKRPPPPPLSIVSSSSSEDSSSDSSDEDEDSGDGCEILFTVLPNSVPATSSAPVWLPGSDSSSSDSSSADESEGEEDLKQSVDENTSMMLEKVQRELLPSTLNLLTPLKKSPPRFPMQLSSLNQYNPHLADETANLSPAKQPNRANNFSSAYTSSEGVSAQASYGFTLPAEQAPVLESAQSQTGTSESESDSSSDESDSESDSELSDNELDSTVTLSSNQKAASYNRQVTQPFDLGIVGGGATTCKDESDEPLKRISQQLSKPTSHRKKLAAVLAGNSGLSRSVQNSEESPVSQKRWNRDNLETPAKVPKLESPEEKIQLCDLSDNTALNPCEPEENLNELRAERETGESLLVKIPLSKVTLEAHQKIKPQARVIPIPNVNSAPVGRKRTNSEVNNSEDPPPAARRERTAYPDRRRESSEYHGSRRGWSEYNGRRPAGRNHENDYQHNSQDNEWESPSHHNSESYWSRSSSSRRSGRREDFEESRQSKEHYSDHRGKSAIEHYHQKARSLKHDADHIPGSGTEKVIRYLESVVCFARYGHAMLHKDPNKVEVVFKLYQDTIGMIRHCHRLGGENKSLQTICLRCHSVLLWRMYHLKQNRVGILHKELTEHFSTSSTKMPQKSPYHTGSFSPLPSPASVSSTASSCSGAGPSSQDPSPSQTLPRQIASKVTEHLTLTGYMHQSLELWRQSELIAEQCRDVFSSVDHKIGRITLFSSISHIADWMDHCLRNMSNRWNQ